MKSGLYVICFWLVLVLGCKDEEEIVPLPPVANESDAQKPPPVTDEEGEPSKPVDMDVFHYGKFEKLPYRILYPRHYDSGASYPMHIFLHGMGERGDDNEKHLAMGSAFFLADSIREKYPAIIVYPQCPLTSFWFDEEISTMVKTMIDTLRRQLNADRKRISIGGFSMGAYGTFEIVARNPGYFEAAIAISGVGDEKRIESLAQSRWQIFAGQKDDIVPSSHTRRIAEALKEAGASIQFTLYPDADHTNTWVRAFSEPHLYAWLFPVEDDGRPKAD